MASSITTRRGYATRIVFVACLLICVIAAIVAMARCISQRAPANVASTHGRSLDVLLKLPSGEFEKLDVVELNLACAREIPACSDLDVPKYRKTLDDWAAHVKHEID